MSRWDPLVLPAPTPAARAMRAFTAEVERLMPIILAAEINSLAPGELVTAYVGDLDDVEERRQAPARPS